MAYQSLYRRYRPRRFSDVRGQGHIVGALRNAVRDDRVGHAYLFSGSRGTGKTSTARILAKALNCEHLTDGEPDGTCESCLAIDAGTSYDVQELDAASNNGVGDVRELIGRVNLGSPGRTKVYILDEVHMLTAQASAALLKTLEEPPDHVVFVLATTDPQKVLPTIRSRTQHFDFHLLSADELTEHVAWVIHDAGLGLDDDVIPHVVRAGAGSARDTLSALDQVAAAGGVVDHSQPLDDLLDAVAEADAGRALVAVANAVAAGRDPRVLGEAVLARLRDVFLVRMGAATDHLPPGDIERVRSWAGRLGDRATTRALEAVGDALLEMRQAPDPRIPLEVALVKITRADVDGSVATLAARVTALEAALGAATETAGVPAPEPSREPAQPGPAPPVPPTQSTAGGPEPSPAADPGGGAAPARPAPPPRPGARPADGARARLAANRADHEGAPTDPSPAPAPAPPPPAAPTPPDPPTDAAPHPPSVEPSPSAAAEPSAAAPPPSVPAGGEPDREQLESLWADSILPGLGGLTKAMFSVGHFTEVSGTEAVFALPNEVHRQKCEQKRAEVEAVLSGRLGSEISLRLVVDETAGARSGTPAATGGRPTQPANDDGPGPEDDLDLTGGDVHDLEDASDVPAGGLDALTRAFPGATLEDR